MSVGSRLFAPFIRLQPVCAQGPGLGLSIVRPIVEQLAGRVGVESAPGAVPRTWVWIVAVAVGLVVQLSAFIGLGIRRPKSTSEA